MEVDLLSDLLKRIDVGIKRKNEDIIAKKIPIKYDYIPKYCKTCKLQGHSEEECHVLHSEFFDE